MLSNGNSKNLKLEFNSITKFLVSCGLSKALLLDISLVHVGLRLLSNTSFNVQGNSRCLKYGFKVDYVSWQD